MPLRRLYTVALPLEFVYAAGLDLPSADAWLAMRHASLAEQPGCCARLRADRDTLIAIDRSVPYWSLDGQPATFVSQVELGKKRIEKVLAGSKPKGGCCGS